MNKYARSAKLRPFVAAAALLMLCGAPATIAHSPTVNGFVPDWCIGAESNTAVGGGRAEDSYIELTCGQCATGTANTQLACVTDADCVAGGGAGPCQNIGSKVEKVWWDNRTDGAVNDLATVAITSDANNLYIAAELWVDPDPVSLPFGELAIDFIPGGKDDWYDPNNALLAPGNCSVSTDRACTSDADCHFCTESTEPFPSTRLRACGSGCNPDVITDICDVTQTCQNLGTLAQGVGVGSNPQSLPDILVLFDFGRWLIGLNDHAQVRVHNVGADTWDIVSAHPVQVNPGASGGSGGPPGSVEVAIPWTDLGGAFGPEDDFRFNLLVARGTLTNDYTPDGAIEDVQSEGVAGATTTTTDSCPGMGAGTTACELADSSVDSLVPGGAPAAGSGDVDTLLLNKSATADLSWGASCLASDTDYEVYVGSIGNWYSHTSTGGLCTTGGATSASLVLGGGDEYYLVVPSDGVVEGSYGVDSAGAERPDGAVACKTQTLGTCP